MTAGDPSGPGCRAFWKANPRPATTFQMADRCDASVGRTIGWPAIVRYIRLPPGRVLAHRRGYEARYGFGYEHSDLQAREIHLIQHSYEGYK
jgi:putative RNase toxin 8 of polymorphic toxin system